MPKVEATIVDSDSSSGTGTRHAAPLQSETPIYAEVVVPLPVEGPFTYLLHPDQITKAEVGVRVRVPFKNREITGFLVAVRKGEISSPAKLKNVIEVLDDQPVISERTLRLTRWLADYYFSSWGEAIETAVPKWVKQGRQRAGAGHPESQSLKAAKGLEILGPFRPQEDVADPPPSLLRLTGEQEQALRQIKASLKETRPRPILLYGVTGSGKTELYIRAIKEVLAQKKGAIVLVPEIALTEQIRQFFFEHFGIELEILHSKLSDGERFLAWKRIESGEKKVLLGPRSALFAPMPRLGLIVIDEEQEGSYKQDQTPRYHAREVARWLTEGEGALLILGSATPSLESMHLAAQGLYKRVDLTQRVNQKGLPHVTVVDLKAEGDIQKRSVIFSRLLAREIETNLQKKEGTIMLLNRRGFSTQVHCPSCGERLGCPSCEVALTFHQADDRLLCHYCNYQTPTSRICARCAMPLLRFKGFGTEKVESELGRLFPQARVVRMDADAIRKKGSHEQILKDFREEKIDILVGTQMIAKGFDFPHVTLVGVVLADTGLILPDFRSGERTFQLLTQVAGRAGRGENSGRVIIQTYSPDHPSVVCAKDHDYLKFYEQEIKSRARHHYPPARGLINFLIRSRTEKKAHLFARELRESLSGRLDIGTAKGTFEIIGPAPLPFYRLRGHYRWHVLVKTGEMNQARALLRSTLAGLKRRSGVAMQIDVDPLNIL